MKAQKQLQMKNSILFSLILLLSSCSAGFHLKQAKMHLKKAEQKGAVITPDTVFVTKEVIVPEVKFDTVLRDVNFYDTITVTKDKIVTKFKINVQTKEVFVQTICPPDTLRIKVPVTVTNDIVAGKAGMELWLWILAAACIGAVLSKIFWR